MSFVESAGRGGTSGDPFCTHSSWPVILLESELNVVEYSWVRPCRY